METEMRPAQRDYVDKCLRACRGLPDPEAAIGRLVEAAERFINPEALEDAHAVAYRYEALECALKPFLDRRGADRS